MHIIQEKANEVKEIKRISTILKEGMKLRVEKDIFTITKIEDGKVYTDSSLPPADIEFVARAIVTKLPANVEIVD